MIQLGDDVEFESDNGVQYSNDHTFGETVPPGTYKVTQVLDLGLVQLKLGEFEIIVAAAHINDSRILRLRERSLRFRAPTIENHHAP